MKYFECKYKLVIDDLGFIVFMFVLVILTSSFIWLLLALLGTSIKEVDNNENS